MNLSQIVLKKIIKNFLKNKLILKTQQRFKSKRHNIFTEEVNKIALSSTDDKKMQSLDSTEIYAYRKEQRSSN